MSLEGTVINGQVVLDGGAALPEGVRVRIDVEEMDDLVPPAEPYDRVSELEGLREALADVQAGRTRPFREALTEIGRRYNIPPTSEK